jgi:hypothetical protein
MLGLLLVGCVVIPGVPNLLEVLALGPGVGMSLAMVHGW